MVTQKKIKVGKRVVEAILTKLGDKNLIVLKGSKGYIMCGYLNMKVANKFKDIGIKIVGVSTIEQAIKTKVNSMTYTAKKIGIYKGQEIKDVLKIIV
ncbi:MAG: DUF1805 domain-containing protein [Candidatus Omnitrophica bacterium]|nr:DUF1805 domain-containing protein [Candidatus Omnitrophota bacterium]